MNKLVFAQLIGFIVHRVNSGSLLGADDIRHINSLIEQGYEHKTISLKEMFNAMLNNQKITELIDADLRTSKDEIERIMNRLRLDNPNQ